MLGVNVLEFLYLHINEGVTKIKNMLCSRFDNIIIEKNAGEYNLFKVPLCFGRLNEFWLYFRKTFSEIEKALEM